MSYHAKMMNVLHRHGNDDSYKAGHRDARHDCAEIACEADAEIQRLRTKLAESEAACAGYRAALEFYADKDGNGIYDYGTDGNACIEYRGIRDSHGILADDGQIARQVLGSNPGKAVGDVIAAARELAEAVDALDAVDARIKYLGGVNFGRAEQLRLLDVTKPPLVVERDKALEAYRAALTKLEGRE